MHGVDAGKDYAILLLTRLAVRNTLGPQGTILKVPSHSVRYHYFVRINHSFSRRHRRVDAERNFFIGLTNVVSCPMTRWRGARDERWRNIQQFICPKSLSGGAAAGLCLILKAEVSVIPLSDTRCRTSSGHSHAVVMGLIAPSMSAKP